MAFQKYFLDTTVMRPIMVGGKEYKKYLNDFLGGSPAYISRFVRMEFMRGYIRNILDFYFTLESPGVNTIGEAIEIWSNNFKSSQLKSVLSFLGFYLDSHPYDRNSVMDKENALVKIGSLVKRLIVKLNSEFRTIGTNSTRCKRAELDLPISTKKNSEVFGSFLQKFNNVKAFREKCALDSFFVKRFRKEIEAYFDYANRLTRNQENKGFLDILDKLKEVLYKGGEACSCKLCEGIGDAIIALDSPREMELQHTDHSFDYLCSLIGQPHKKHPSEQRFYKQKS